MGQTFIVIGMFKLLVRVGLMFVYKFASWVKSRSKTSDVNFQRTVETSKVPQLDIGVPVLHKPTPKKLTFSSMQPLQEEEKNTMNFTLMTKKGNKQQLKAFEVPIDSTLVTNLKNREEVGVHHLIS